MTFALNPGSQFAGFRIVSKLGSGGMGEVYLVDHPRLPRREALKILSSSFSGDDDYRQRFLREAELASQLWHPNLVSLHDRGEFDGRLWISMDYIDGSDAGELVRAKFPTGMPAERVAAIITGIASALDYAHQRGMLHRDVKPANILCSSPGVGEERIALADFGIAREINDAAGLTATNMTLGTVIYAAPEQLLGDPVDGRSDQYALAATAFHLLTGSTPFQSTNPVAIISQHLTAPPPRVGEFRPDLASLDMVFATALSKEPGNRYPTCSEFAKDFERRVSGASSPWNVATQAGMPLPSPPDVMLTQPRAGVIPTNSGHSASPNPSAQSGSRRMSRKSWVAASAIFAIIAGAGVWALAGHTDKPGTGNLAGSKPAQASRTNDSKAVTANTDEQPAIEAVGFGRPANSDYLWATSFVRHAKPGQFIVVSFNVLGPDGKILATQSQTEQAVNPDATMIIGNQITVPKGKEVARVEASLGVNDYGGPTPKLTDVVLQTADYSIGEDMFGKPIAEAILKNPSTSPVNHARVGIACFDDRHTIIGGGSSFPSLIPAGGQIKVSQTVMVSQRPARCEMTAQPSDF